MADRAGPEVAPPRRASSGLALALAAHDPERTLERGYALVEDGRRATPITSAADARVPRTSACTLLRLGDGDVACEPLEGASERRRRPPPRPTRPPRARIEAIIRRLDSGEAGLRETLDLCREGRALVEFCAAELEAVGQGLEELRLDELVARLEAGAAPPAAQ